MKKESPCGFSSASAIIWYCEYCNPVPFSDIYTSFAPSFFQVVVTQMQIRVQTHDGANLA